MKCGEVVTLKSNFHPHGNVRYPPFTMRIIRKVNMKYEDFACLEINNSWECLSKTYTKHANLIFPSSLL